MSKCIFQCGAKLRSLLDDEKYERQKADFTDALLRKHKDYSTYLGNINFCDEKLKIIDTEYVHPRMTLDNHETGSIGGRQGTWRIQSTEVLLPDLFSDGQRNFSRIYIAGDAGYGKTALCHMMILAWIEGIDGEKMNEYIPSDFVEAMKQFEFLFYISLRSYTHTSSVSEMVREQYFVNRPFYDSFILKENSCLIILDGLDEWKPPERHESPSPMNPIPGLPDSEIVKKYTILTTSRKWELEKLRLDPDDIDRKILLNEFTEETAMDLIKKIIQNRTKGDGAELKDKLKDRRLAPILKVPVLIKWFIVLWEKNKDLTQINSQIQLYIDIIDNMLNDLYKLQKEKQTENEASMANRKETGANLLPCFKKKMYCKHFSRILMSLSILAFELWLKGQLVFSQDADVEGLSEKDITSCLEMGLLCQDVYGPHKRNAKKILTFLHKSFQDFFTALYIIMNAEKKNMTDVYIKLWENWDDSVFIFMSAFDSEITTDAFNKVLIYLNQTPVDLNTMDEIAPFPESGNFFELQELLCDCVQTSMEQNKPVQCKIEHIFIHSSITHPILPRVINLNSSSINTLVIDEFEWGPNKIDLDCIDQVTKCKSIKSFKLVSSQSRTLREAYDKLLTAVCETWLLSTLDLSGDGCVFLLDYIHHEKVDKLSELRVLDINDSDNTTNNTFFEGMQKASQLQVLEIVCFHQPENYDMLDLSEFKQLKQLIIRDCCIDTVKINTTSLIYCEVSGSSILFVSNGSTINICSLSLSNMKNDSESLNEIAAVLPKLTHLVHLKLINLSFGDLKVCLSPEAESLENVELYVQMSEDGFINFLKSVPITKHHVKFKILNAPDEVLTYIETNFVEIENEMNEICCKSKLSERQ